MSRVAGEGESILGGAVRERAVAVVDVQHVAAVHAEIVHARNVDIETTVAVDIGHRDAALPPDRIGDARAVGDVLEPEVAQVAVQPVGAQVRREIQIDQSITVDVAGRHAAAVVVVQVIDDVDRGVGEGQSVGERDPARLRRDNLEDRWCGRRCTTAQHESRE